MDEVRMVRDSYPEPAPPTAREIARVKALLNTSRRRPLPRLRWGLGGMITAGAAAAVAIAFAGGNTPAPPHQVHLDGRATILTAALKAEQQPAGKYWTIDVIDGQSFIVRAKTGTYAITGAASESFNWQGVKTGMGEAYYLRDLPAHPQDASLWRKAGSPSSFHVWAGDHYDNFTTKVTKWRDSGPEAGFQPSGGGRFLDGKSAGDLQNLPADPAKLAEMFLSPSALRFGKAAGGPATSAAIPRIKIGRVVGLLFTPLPPKVRAGLMRALADQPGISTGRGTDPLGRQGVALASNDRLVGSPKDGSGGYRSRTVAVFDEGTGALLSIQDELTKPGGEYAEMKPGFIINYQAVRSAKWTDTKQTPPAALPFG